MIRIVNPDAGGIDIGSEEVYVAVPEDRDEQSIRRFGVFTADIHEMAKWLKACRITTVALESTGVYWIPIYTIVQDYGIAVQLVNAKHIKNVPGRKSDVRDCRWLQELHTLGLLRGSFIPDEAFVVLRSYMRHRDGLIEHRAVHVNHMQKAMTQMNVRLNEVLTDITGTTGMAIMRAIAGGEQRPEQLLKHRNKRCQHSAVDFVKALTANYRAEHVFTLKQSLALYDFYSEQIKACDNEVKTYMATINPSDHDQDIDGSPRLPLEPSRKTGTHSKNAPDFDVRSELYRLTGVDLTDVDGLHASTAQTIISEIGMDMSKWPTAKHFAAWMGLAPKNDITGGRVRRSRILPGNRRASQALRMAAQSLLKSKSALGAYARIMRARIGPQQAIVATAHKLARIIYTMLKDKKPFIAASAEDYDKAQHARELKTVKRRAAKLGLTLVPA